MLMDTKKWMGLGVGVAALAALCAWFYLSRTPAPSSAPSATGAPPAAASDASSAPLTPPAPVDEVVRQTVAARPVIYIGLDAADWDVLDLQIKAGAMPNLARLVQESDIGQIETLHPPLSPIVWTSMATGADPTRHGVLDFVHLRPDTGEKEPITSSERKLPAIWNMTTYAGKSVAVFGLWATYPAEPVKGLLVSDRMFTFLYHEATPPPGAVFPADREAWAREVEKRVERETDYKAVRAYMPWLTEAEYTEKTSTTDPYGNPVGALRRILIDTRIYHELATDWIRSQKPDLAFVYFEGTDSIGHVFAPFAPPRQDSISADDYARYSNVPRLYFHRIDEMLGDYRKLAEANGATMLITSDHGFTWGEGRPKTLSSFANATAAKWHRTQGMYLIWRPGTPRASAARGQASVMQVCPTLLALTGLPRGIGINDTPIAPVTFASSAAIDYGRFYHPVPLPPAPASKAGAAGEDERLAQLRALGYIGASEPSRVTPVGTGADRTRSPGSYNNEGLVLKNQGRIDDAIKAFDKAIAMEPKLASALWNLSDILFDKKRDVDRSDDLLLQALGAGLPEAPKYVIGRAIGYQRAGEIDRSLKLLGPATRIKPDEPDFWLFDGRYLVERGDCPKAVEDFSRAVALAPRNPAAYSARALGRVCAGDQAGARADLQQALALNPSDEKVRGLLRELGKGK
jgi:tetratricopeptide (TPR) repeat protein